MKIAIFGGTSEATALAGQLAGRGAAVTLFVATEYGEQVAGQGGGYTILAGRLDREQMSEQLRTGGYGCVLDATHPYATEVTAGLQAVCDSLALRRLRITREGGGADGCISAEDPAAAVRLLRDMPGRVLLTTGSKQLAEFTALPNWQERLYARVLPSAEVVGYCEALGFRGSRLICMQGPFSREINAAMLRTLEIEVLVTKDGGAAGGFPEKLAAARECGVPVIVLRRPSEPESLSPADCLLLLEGEYGLCPQEERSAHFPLFVPIRRREVLVVGGGAVAARRVEVLLDFGAQVTVTAPRLCAALAERGHSFLWQQQVYDGIAQPYALATAATDDRETNRRVGLDARRAGIPVSVADSPAESTFWFPAVVQERNLVAGITSTDGDHPAVKLAAARLRKEWGKAATNGLDYLCE